MQRNGGKFKLERAAIITKSGFGTLAATYFLKASAIPCQI
jgi:hypothetical protein